MRKSDYVNIHKWLLRNKIKSGICEHCGEKKETQNAKKKYCQHKRNVNNYIELCIDCHKKYDDISRKIKIKWEDDIFRKRASIGMSKAWTLERRKIHIERNIKKRGTKYKTKE